MKINSDETKCEGLYSEELMSTDVCDDPGVRLLSPASEALTRKMEALGKRVNTLVSIKPHWKQSLFC